MIKSWANVITSFRIVVIPLFLFFLLSPERSADIIAALVFSLAAISDTFDGYLARARNEISSLGRYFDPLADKLLVSCGLLGLVELGLLSVWIAFVIISRELIISSLRSYALSKGIVIESSYTGKVKTWFQFLAILFYVFIPRTSSLTWGGHYSTFSELFMMIALLVTIVSGFEYFIKSKKIFLDF